MRKYPLQVSKRILPTKLVFEDLESFARHINTYGLSCAIYKVNKRIVLMREIEEDETIQVNSNGVVIDIPIESSSAHSLADTKLYKERKMIKEFKVNIGTKTE